VTDRAIKAPRPGRFSRTCPAPGISQAKRMAENHFDDGREAGLAKGVVGAGVRGKPAPGISLTALFYRIRGRPSEVHADTDIRTAGIRYQKSSAGVGFDKLQFLIVDFHSVLGARG